MSAALTAYAKHAYETAREMEATPEARARVVATTVGRHAKRLGMTADDVSEWLQVAYGQVWVVGGYLNPGLDMREVRKLVLKAMA